MLKKVLSILSAIVGVIAVALAIVAVVTKNWVSVQGNTNELRAKFGELLNENGTFVTTAAATVAGVGLPLPIAKLVVIGIANATLVQVEGVLSGNLRSTTYSLFDKKIQEEIKAVSEFKLPQGLVIAGLACLFFGTSLGAILLLLNGGLQYVNLFTIIPLLFLVIGSTLIILGYLLFTKIITEDFGHELGITVSLGYSFVLIAIASIIGFLTAVGFASSMISHVHRATSAKRVAGTTDTIGQAVSLKDRRRYPGTPPAVLTESF